METILLATYRRDIRHHLELAQAHGAGLELQVYGYDPELLDGGWRELVAEHKALLDGFEGALALHGAFYDLCPASLDRRVAALARERFLLNLDIAAELGARHVVFHTDFIPTVPNLGYRSGWTERQVAFWRGMLHAIGERRLTVALENMWEPQPDILGEVLDRIASPLVGACLDVGHCVLYSADRSPANWVARLGERLVHCHLNNHGGRYDDHLALDAPGGVIRYREDVLPLLTGIPTQPWCVLEMDDPEHLERSLRYLGR